MKKLFKTAFTLAEMLIVLGIIGVLMAVAVTIMRPQDMGRRAQIASALSNFDNAMYNAYANFSGDEKEHPFSSENTSGKAQYLCKAISSYLHTTTNNCSSATAITLSAAADNSNFKKGSTNRAKYLQFTTTSGMDVFLTNREDKTPPFYIMFIDVNGSKGPNSTLYTEGSGLVSSQYPDIYPFAIISLGRVIPMGIMENDPKLLTATMTCASITSEFSTTTYTKAKSQAWGFYTTDFKTKFGYDVSYTKSPDDNGMADEPYAYNDFIRSQLGNYKYLQVDNLENTEKFNCPYLRDTATNTEKEFYDGSCSVQVDLYTF